MSLHSKALPAIFSTEIKPEWLDYNNHLNVAYYVLIFDQAGESLVRSLGLGEEVTKATGISWVVLENHITYDNEVSLGQNVEVRVRLVDYDHKRLHLYYEMHVVGDEGYLAATLEQMIMCMDLKVRRSANFPDDFRVGIKEMEQQQEHIDPPTNIGRKIGIRK